MKPSPLSKDASTPCPHCHAPFAKGGNDMASRLISILAFSGIFLLSAERSLAQLPSIPVPKTAPSVTPPTEPEPTPAPSQPLPPSRPDSPPPLTPPQSVPGNFPQSGFN